jgi:replicative DNA helicase
VTISAQVPPHNAEAEQCCIAACLVDVAAIDALAPVIHGPEAFYLSRHRLLYSTVRRLHERGESVDIITVSNDLRERGQLDEAGGSAYFFEITNILPTIANIEHYGRIVHEHHVRRQAMILGRRLHGAAFAEDFQAEFDACKDALMDITLQRRSNELVHISEGVKDLSAEIERCYPQGIASAKLVQTGITSFDRVTGGIYRSTVVVVAGRPGMGKTSLVEKIGFNVSRTAPFLFFTLEDPGMFLVAKSIGIAAGVSSSEIIRGPLDQERLRKINAGCNILYDRQIWYTDQPSSIDEIRDQVRRFVVKHGAIGAVAIDRLELIDDPQGEQENYVQYLGRLSKGLVRLAKEYDIPVILIVQLNRKCEDRKDKRPMLSDLRGSGAIEQDCRMALFLYRDKYYYRDSKDGDVAEIIIAKNNLGKSGTIKMAWREEIPTFEELETRYDEEEERNDQPWQ